MSREFHDETFALRVAGLTPDLQSRLRDALAGMTIESRNPEIAVVVLRSERDVHNVRNLMERSDFMSLSYGVWISLVTSREQDTIAVPTYILNLIYDTAV